MGRAMFTIIGVMAELESSLISERVTAGMRASQVRGRHLGRPGTPQRAISEIEALIRSTMTRQLTSGRAFQFIVMNENRRCSTLFHLLVPGGR